MKKLTYNAQVNKPTNGIDIQYPILMKCTSVENIDLIVLMESHEVGVAIVGSKDYPVGYFDEEWVQSEFRPFEGELVLSNKTI
jgi:hypothetical protein